MNNPLVPSNWIQNISKKDVAIGNHFQVVPGRDVLIQIVDPCVEFPTPKFAFGEIHQFEFLDIEEQDDFAITTEQAEQIAAILLNAKTTRKNVVVHCHAGLCRSGAVAEVGVMLGFTDPEVIRLPNTRVKQFLMDALDLSINSTTSAFND